MSTHTGHAPQLLAALVALPGPRSATSSYRVSMPVTAMTMEAATVMTLMMYIGK